MTERLLCADFTIVTEADALAFAESLDCNLQHGLAPWQEEQKLTFDADGYLAVVVCSIPAHNAAHLVLATFTGKQITRKALETVEDCAADPVPEDAIKVLVEKPNLTAQEKDELLLLLGKRVAG